MANETAAPAAAQQDSRRERNAFNDAFDALGYLADLGTGSFYLVARSLETNGADVSHADGDYGTRFLATAGVLNLLAALHAYEAARGRKG